MKVCGECDNQCQCGCGMCLASRVGEPGDVSYFDVNDTDRACGEFEPKEAK